MLCNCNIVIVQLLLRSHCKAGGNDGQCICSKLFCTLAHADGLCGGDAASAGINRHTTLDLIDHRCEDLFFLSGRKGVCFAVGAQREDSMHTARQQTLYLLAQLFMIDGLLCVIVHRGDYRRDNTFDIAGLHNVLSFSVLFFL